MRMLAFCIGVLGWSCFPAAADLPLAGIAVDANPPRVCMPDRDPLYPNFDLVVTNSGPREAKLKQVRVFAQAADGAVLERRILWGPALADAGKATSIAPGAQGLLFNPFVFSSALKRAAGLRYELEFEDDTPMAFLVVALERCVQKTRLVLPLEGRVMVLDGYDMLSHHRRWSWIGPRAKAFGVIDNYGRFGVDLEVVDDQASMFKGDGKRNEDWHTWGRPVRAAGNGLVAAVHNEQPDNDQVGTENLWTSRSPVENEMTSYGNYVLIDHENGEFSLVGHLQRGSVKVKKGDRVRVGEVVAKAGNSGSVTGALVPLRCQVIQR